MAAALEPTRLAELVDMAERPRVDGWSLRAALCRYAQPQPERAGALLSVLRRIEAAINEHTSTLRTHGAELLERSDALRSDGGRDGGRSDGPVEGSSEGSSDSGSPSNGDSHDEARVVSLLALASEVDEAAEAIASWAVERSGERPDLQIDEITARAADRLVELGVPDEAPPPRGTRGRG